MQVECYCCNNATSAELRWGQFQCPTCRTINVLPAPSQVSNARLVGQPAATKSLTSKNSFKSPLIILLVCGVIAFVSQWWGIIVGLLLLGWAIAGVVGKVKRPAAFVYRDSMSSMKLSAISLGFGGFVTTCGVMGVTTPRSSPSSAEVQQPKVYGSNADVDPTLTDAERPYDTGSNVAVSKGMRVQKNTKLPLKLFKNDDRRSGIKDQKARVLIIEGELSEPELRKALTDYYLKVRSELEDSPNKVRHIWLFAFPTEARAKAGMGEWHGRAKAIAINGEPLPLVPELTINLPNKDVPQPTAQEDEIYDMLVEELYAEDSSAEYQKKVLAQRSRLTQKDLDEMARLDERDEKRARQRVAKHYKITLKQLDTLYLKVLVARE